MGEILAQSRPEIGIPLGVLIGVLSGFVAAILVGTLQSKLDLKAVLQVTGEFVAIPAFWFGGSWLSGQMLESVAIEDIVSSYVLALAITFVAVLSYPLFKYVKDIGQRIGQSPSGAQG